MPLIVIAVFVLFLFVAPKLFKILLTIHIITAVVAFFVLLFLGGIGGALRGGPNAGLYEEEAIYLLLYICFSRNHAAGNCSWHHSEDFC